ncbi:hypothetical protein G5B30_07085 [Sphingobacterium sp. SGG-5]|uniref:hypothetical protein n=1 Tax=Sphingobacterium sp. SGG-5 TaxID=2710881 RepID=UPI0013E9BC56|nr:hypothetical protein [Sphingobacterium sp. SGG-5]NGM61680.1 hypothetical protein [Sphingobacterium sp. SGG-5]
MAKLEIDEITYATKKLGILVRQTDELKKQRALLTSLIQSSSKIEAVDGPLGNTYGGPVPTFSLSQNKYFKEFTKQGETADQKKKLEEQLAKAMETGIQKGIEGLFNSITNLGKNFEEVFSNVFTKLANTVTNTFGQALSTELGSLIGKKMGSKDFSLFGMGSTASKATIAGAGMLGSVLYAQGTKRNEEGLMIGGGALSGAVTGMTTGLALAGTGATIGSVVPVIGTIAGALLGGLAGLFGFNSAKKAEEQRQEMIEEQKRQTALQERANALAYTSSITGRMSNQGIITGSDINEFGQVTFRINGKDMVAVLDRNNNSR